MYYHGTAHADFDPTHINPETGRFDLCVTPDREAAEDYAEEAGGDMLHGFDVRYTYDLDDVAEALEEAGYETEIQFDGPYVYLLLDEEEVQDILLEAGIDCVEYHDEDWQNRAHTCVRAFDPSVLIYLGPITD